MKKILLVMMLVFSTFMFGNPEFEKSYGESITSTLKFGTSAIVMLTWLTFSKSIL